MLMLSLQCLQCMGKVGAIRSCIRSTWFNAKSKNRNCYMDVGKAVTEVKGGKIDFKVDKAGIVHASSWKVSFDKQKDCRKRDMNYYNQLLN
jgi:large subunit ribosomal protein L1